MDPIARMYLARDEDGREQARNYKKPPVRFRASELSDCKRRTWYRLSGWVPAPRTGFDDDWSVDGDVHHDIVRQLMLRWDVKLAGITQSEDGSTHEDGFVVQSFDLEGRSLDVSTRQDGWIWHEDYGWMIMEIKSVGHWKHNYMLKAYTDGWTGEDGTHYPPGETAVVAYLTAKYPAYIYQMHAGMAIAKARASSQLPFDPAEQHTLDHAFLVLKDRSNCHIGFHDDKMGVLGGIVIPFVPETWDKVLRRLYTTKGKVLDGTPPLPEYTAGSRECGYCPYRYACHDATKRRAKGLTPAIVFPDPAVGIHFDEADPSDDSGAKR